MSVISSVNPRTGETFGEPFPPTSDVEVAALASDAAEAAPGFEALGRSGRAALLRAMGAALDARRGDIVAIADAETGLGEARLNGELTRTVYQLGLFADVIEEGSYLEAAIDHAADTPMGPGPDLRRMLVPLGPVAVFGASNFPLAFSVPGGDTASALAAGSPVIVKAHESHPATSQLTFEILRHALRDSGVDERVLGIVYGREAAAALVADPRVKAVGFTGSLRGGKALLDIINTRPEPIPFYGEMSSLNPVVLTEAALRERGGDIAEGLLTSVTGSAGQFCTKPGLVFVPSGADGDAFTATLAKLFANAPVAVALNQGIAESYATARAGQSNAANLVAESTGTTSGFAMVPRLFSVDAADLTETVVEECFGPTTVLVRYDTLEALREAVVAKLPSSLTATIHSGTDDEERVAALSTLLRDTTGRVLYNGFPTGVRVSWAQNHGGPWPSTNSAHTSVGATAIRRFLRPVTWQNAPAFVLPPELRDEATDVPRRIDGELRLPGAS
ncbi:aldehyde dehydrogenase (NADP(+)) [Stackebrandtia nassauensis]|uniref:Aldehyde Dehydrogenase n=1 Tax=Stackebrandtia nassauensis (strain DSM 44728 / CIP 108903 / NRRL B-16338 / NBRC 102104 / LLR-40K-21) TaxID=446470 RepID=D3Q114_STANL|nr:aldehyde dehydrogenase (NADP(+)) [Stackebrandtia nassauensis]ADD43764.1 Aldehyde Dehydrogenase [Stackebrandtia nassauensis DSM 44728]